MFLNVDVETGAGATKEISSLTNYPRSNPYSLYNVFFKVRPIWVLPRSATRKIVFRWQIFNLLGHLPGILSQSEAAVKLEAAATRVKDAGADDVDELQSGTGAIENEEAVKLGARS